MSERGCLQATFPIRPALWSAEPWLGHGDPLALEPPASRHLRPSTPADSSGASSASAGGLHRRRWMPAVSRPSRRVGSRSEAAEVLGGRRSLCTVTPAASRRTTEQLWVGEASVLRLRVERRQWISWEEVADLIDCNRYAVAKLLEAGPGEGPPELAGLRGLQ